MSKFSMPFLENSSRGILFQNILLNFIKLSNMLIAFSSGMNGLKAF